MKRILIAAVCLVVVAACSSKKSEPSAERTPSAPPASAVPAQAGKAPATPAAAEKIEITEDLVQKYMEYDKQSTAIIARYAEQSRQNLASAKGDSAKMLQQISINDKLSKEMDEQLKAKRAEMGLNEAQFTALEDAAGMIANGRLLYNQMGGDAQLARIQAEQKQQVAALPEAKRAEAEKAISDMTKSLTDLRDGVELRQKYDDKSADVLLKHADQLANLRLEALKLLGGKK